MAQDDLNMVEVAIYVTNNYNGLWEIYTTKINQEQYSFDNFCMMMYIANLKQNQ